MPTIDADAHVIETERTWEYMDESDRKLKPIRGFTSNDPAKRYWLIDGNMIRVGANIGPDTSESSREMKDIEARLRHMDQLGVDIQVLYPSLFLIPLTMRPRVERALARSYNRWLADIWRKGENRLRWAAVIPTLNMDHALAEARFAKDNGACALYLRAGPYGNQSIGCRGALARTLTEGLARVLDIPIKVTESKPLSDPYFYPLYKEASDLNLPICIHASEGSFVWQDVCRGAYSFSKFKLPVVSSFHSLAYSAISEKFPKLRFGFIEVGAQWIPYALHDLARRLQKDGRHFSSDFIRQNRFYVACQTDDDLNYVIQYAGEDSIVIGSDYGHADTASEIDALRRLKSTGDVNAKTIEKIASQNPRILYDL